MHIELPLQEHPFLLKYIQSMFSVNRDSFAIPLRIRNHLQTRSRKDCQKTLPIVYVFNELIHTTKRDRISIFFIN